MSATGVSLHLARELKAICGDEHVTETAASDQQSGAPRRPGVGIPGIPTMTVAPARPDEVVAILRLANERQFTVAPVGGGTDLSVSQHRPDVLLQTTRLTEVEHYDHGDLTVGIGAGTKVAQLGAMVGADQLIFACDPPFPERATIGGVLAAAEQGPMRHAYGSVRDFCIGVRFVTGDGRKAKGGGRVVKNVAGYDMMKLLIGSYGTLGVITSASFKLFPAPRKTLTFLAEFGAWQEALKFRDLVMHSPLSPMCLELVSPRARKLMRPAMTDDAWVICVRATGSDAVLARYRKELGAAITREVAGPDESAIWKAIENFPRAEANEDSTASPCVLLHVPPAHVGEVVAKLDRSQAEGGLEAAVVGRVAIGALIARITAPQALDVAPGGFWDRLAPPPGVSATTRGTWWGITAEQKASMNAVKQALDPNNVLRGRELF